MKIAVISDSHGFSSKIEDVIFKETPDCVFFLGDCLKDLDNVYTNIPIYSVCGNNDFGHQNIEDIRRLFGKTFFFTHGHKYNVKYSLDALINKAHLLRADFLLFGHTHLPKIFENGELTVLNPGSIGYSDSYAIISIQQNKINAEIKFL